MKNTSKKSAKAQVENANMVQKAPSVVTQKTARALAYRSWDKVDKVHRQLKDALLDALNDGWWATPEAEFMREFLSMLSVLTNELGKLPPLPRK